MISLDKIPDALGHLVLNEDGAILASGGELENNEDVANVVYNLITLTDKLGPEEGTYKKISGEKNLKRSKIVPKSPPFTVVKDMSRRSEIPAAIEGPQISRSRHNLSIKEGDNRKTRRGCKGCKQKCIDRIIHKNKIKKIITYCPQCPGEPFYCRTCFMEAHS